MRTIKFLQNCQLNGINYKFGQVIEFDRDVFNQILKFKIGHWVNHGNKN
jgi:hypothetical protein